MPLPLLIAAGGALGTLARYGVDGWILARTGSSFPWGTLGVNVSGSFLLALLVRFLEGVLAPPEWRALLAIGFCGAYTTFSTFGFEAVGLLQGGQWLRATGYLVGSVVLSLLSVVLGFRLAVFLLGAWR
jgi:CrcB protein